MIPRVFHQIWLDSSPELTSEYYKWRESWTKYNPSWNLVVWNDTALTRLKLRWPELPGKYNRLYHKSEIYRYEIIQEYGGVYLDTDMECCKCINPLLLDCSAFIVERAYSETEPIRNRVTPCVFGAIPHHPFLQNLVRSLGSWDHERVSGFSTDYMMKMVEGFGDDIVRRIPAKMMNPYLPGEAYGPPRTIKEFPDAYALHHWGTLRRRNSDSLRNE